LWLALAVNQNDAKHHLICLLSAISSQCQSSVSGLRITFQRVKQRTKVEKIFANEESCLRLLSAIVTKVSE